MVSKSELYFAFKKKKKNEQRSASGYVTTYQSCETRKQLDTCTPLREAEWMLARLSGLFVNGTCSLWLQWRKHAGTHTHSDICPSARVVLLITQCTYLQISCLFFVGRIFHKSMEQTCLHCSFMKKKKKPVFSKEEQGCAAFNWNHI